MLESRLADYPLQFRSRTVPSSVLQEAKKRVLDSLGCFYGAFDDKPGRLLRKTLTADVTGGASLWGTARRVPGELAAWANGTCVRTLDYNDTYLSKEPCHPSDLIASFWAACEVSEKKHQGRLLLEAMVLGYETLCRLCDANSLRARGWDHVTYLPIASAVGCSYILGLSHDQTRNAVALAVVGNNALRQTRVETISDWKAACAAYAARAGLSAARLAQAGFTGPSDIFAGRHGFFNQVSGPFRLSGKPFGRPWKIMETHTKYFPAEHHAQSAIEAALEIRNQISLEVQFPPLAGRGTENVRLIRIETFDVAVDIIGSEKEKWRPATRETADHSMPYLVAAALLDGDINLGQYEKKRFLDRDVRRLMARTRVKRSTRTSKMYPSRMPTRVTVQLSNNRAFSVEVLRPKGYAGRPMSWNDVEHKFNRLASKRLTPFKRRKLVREVSRMDEISRLSSLAAWMRADR